MLLKLGIYAILIGSFFLGTVYYMDNSEVKVQMEHPGYYQVTPEQWQKLSE